MNEKPLLSIVIANYNYGRFLEDAIKSVIAQGMGDKIELVICDAASTDNSVEIIRKYAAVPGLVGWWCSEKDGGQSEAFNKGFSHARGEWLTWLNADELYMPGSLKAFERLVSRKPDAVWVTANMLSFDSATRKITRVNWGPHMLPPFLSPKHTYAEVFGPTTFFRKSVYERFGPIDEKLHYGMDTEYWQRLTMGGVRQTRLCHICWAFSRHELSKTVGAQSEASLLRKKREKDYFYSKNGYRMQRSFKNFWYDVWVLWRFVDGSWLVRAWKKFRLEGRTLPVV